MHRSSQAREPSPESSTGCGSSLYEGVINDNWDSSDAEDQPEPSDRKEGQAREDDCTEIDECEVLDRTDGEGSRAGDHTNVDTSILGTPIERGMSEGLEERAVADDKQPSGPVQTPSPIRSSHTSRTQPAIRRNRNKDAIWQPYDTAQRGNRRAARTVSPEEERVTIGNSTDPGPGAEHRPSTEPSQPIGEHAEVEQPAEEPHAVNEDGTSTGAPQRDATGNDARHLAQMEQPEQRNREGDEPASSQIPPSDRAEGISGEQLTQGRESIADQVEEPARLEVSPAHAVARPVTEIPVHLPSLIAQLREGSELDAGVPPADATSVACPEYEASLRPSPLEPVAQSTEEGLPGSDFDGTNLPRSPRRGPRIGPQPHQEGAVRKVRKNPTTLREINRAGTLDAAIADELWGSDGGGDEAGGITAETTAISPQDAERYPADATNVARPAVRKLRKNPTTRREINRAGTRDAAIADELWGSDGGGDEAGGITAETTAVSPPDAERYPAVLPDPEQAQLEAIARQEGEDHLFDTEDLEEDRPPAVAARRNWKVTKPSKIAKPKQAQPGGSSKESRAGWSSRRRAVDFEARMPGVVTQLDATQPDITNLVRTGVRDVVREHDEANDPAPLAVGSISRGPSGSPPEGRVTITFRAFQRGEWIVTDAISVDSANPVEAQAIAERYARDPEQAAHFYDRSLRKVAVDQCVRAAINDGSFTVLMGLGRGLAVTRKLVASATQLLESVETAGPVIEEEEEEL
ncbi:hypothetical protein PMG11_01908 [Penicillium brasilianum]|uniref:Uncharacterized protein n=1 Tax=Penicillium brasilianum TaxID=104259 RepID=A0A0F7TGK3_PENBI|nr:hypothetical protein PMG11_01908 [Penicillium brasilianum]